MKKAQKKYISIREDLMNDKLECLIIEISKPRSMPFLVGTWYRPPNSPSELLNLFEDTMIGLMQKILSCIFWET